MELANAKHHRFMFLLDNVLKLNSHVDDGEIEITLEEFQYRSIIDVTKRET